MRNNYSRGRRAPVRHMPKIYGNLQPRKVSFAWLFRWLSAGLWLGVIAGLGYAALFSGWFSIKKVEVEGTVFLSADHIRHLVPARSTIWFVAKDAITRQVLADDRVESVAVYRGLPDSLRIVVTERRPAALWQSGDVYSVLDADGLAFTQYQTAQLPPSATPIGQRLAAIPHVVDTKSLSVAADHRAVSPGFISFVQATEANLAKLLPEVTIDHIEVADTTYDVTFVAKEGMRVQFNSLGDAGVQVRNLARLVHQKKATLASQVDLRIDRWAYVQ